MASPRKKLLDSFVVPTGMQIFKPYIEIERQSWDSRFPFPQLLITEPNNCECILEINETFIHKTFYERFSVNANYF